MAASGRSAYFPGGGSQCNPSVPGSQSMRDADDLINRILMFDGHPNLQKLGAITVGETAQEMLSLALSSEKAAVAQFNASAKECHDLGDHGTAAVFEDMVRDEEKHADWFEASSRPSTGSGWRATWPSRSRPARARSPENLEGLLLVGDRCRFARPAVN